MGKVKKQSELLKKEVKEIIQKSEETSEKIKKVRIIGEFLEFINRGNVVDLAVGVVVGGAFTAIVNSLVKDLITPLLGLLLGKLDLTNLKFVIGEASFNYGNFLQSILSFLITAVVVFFVVKAINLLHRKKAEATTAASEEEKKDTYKILEEIRDVLKEKK